MLHIKKGDTVLVLSGDDKGKRGKVLEVMPKSGKAVVEGVNIVSRHTKAKKAQEAGGIKKSEAPINLSKIQVVCPETNKPTRVGFAVDAEGKKVRISKKSGKVIDGAAAVKEEKKKPVKKVAAKKADDTAEAAEVKKPVKKTASKAKETESKETKAE